uniref:Uncharacterized protein n=1 Tax=Anguilla anguilla TaxID=7936 RepID=A0A0E9T7U9_ANGAN
MVEAKFCVGMQLTSGSFNCPEKDEPIDFTKMLPNVGVTTEATIPETAEIGVKPDYYRFDFPRSNKHQ